MKRTIIWICTVAIWTVFFVFINSCKKEETLISTDLVSGNQNANKAARPIDYPAWDRDLSVQISDIYDIKGISAKADGSAVAYVPPGATNYDVTIYSKGFCWSTDSNPSINSSKTNSFAEAITGLTINKVYYVRAYAISARGINYSRMISFNSGFLIGSTYQGGLVFYNDGSGRGLVCAPNDQSQKAEWGCDGIEIVGADGSAIGTGNQNTIDIVSSCATAGSAARICYNLFLNSHTNWYLPSRDELNLMYVNLYRQNLGSFNNLPYWSSTESYKNYAWVQFFDSNGTQYGLANKSFKTSVRAIRNFTINPSPIVRRIIE